MSRRSLCGGWTYPSALSAYSVGAGGYRARTRQNVTDSDATIILAPEALTSGTRLTRTFCQLYAKPLLVINARKTEEPDAAALIVYFINERSVRTLNVAGPRASGWPEAHEYAERTVRAVIALLR